MRACVYVCVYVCVHVCVCVCVCVCACVSFSSLTVSNNSSGVGVWVCGCGSVYVLCAYLCVCMYLCA